jgi:hypothetical protein
MTRKEREHDKYLRDETKKKKELGEQGWYIKNKQLMQRNFQ